LEAQSHSNQERRNVSNFGGGAVVKEPHLIRVSLLFLILTQNLRGQIDKVPTPLIATQPVTRSRDVSTLFLYNTYYAVGLTLKKKGYVTQGSATASAADC
jgi:hypothetical protein